MKGGWQWIEGAARYGAFFTVQRIHTADADTVIVGETLFSGRLKEASAN